MSHQVFISFSSKDLKFAEKVYSRLSKNDISCWISSKDIPAGADYQACIVEAINQATVVVLIFSTHANSSNEIAKELSLASKKVLIPTRIEDVLPQGAFQYQLSNRQFIDLFDDFDNRLDDLADRIKGALNPGLASPMPPRKRSVNWKKIGMQLAAVAGLIGLGVGGLFAARGYMYAPSETIAQVAPSPVPLPSNTDLQTKPMDGTNSLSQQINPDAAPSPAKIETTVFATTPGESNGQNAANDSFPVVTTINTAEVLTTSVTTNAPKPLTEISEKVKGLAAMLKDSQRQQRAIALRDTLDTLPKSLNSKEAEILLINTGQYRTTAITTMAENFANNLDGDDLSTILGDGSRQDRWVALKAISEAGRIKKNLTAEEAKMVLNGTGQYLTKSIAVLAPYLVENLDGDDLSTILGDGSRQDRWVALKAISEAGKIKKNLTAEEAKMVLNGTGQYRTKSIAVLAPYLVENLGGVDVATVLGDGSRQDRWVAFTALANLGKVRHGLKPDEGELILKGMDSYASKAVKELSPYLAK